ncbi:MAG: biosynthetic-type acetolactate synthase large subunit [Lachnospiraceae bacterium]|nr:biosynthetic-type acetolactate synthase large subunit [Lachnospiraceae bacterium]
MNGAEILAASLEREGVETVFGYPGVAICPFYDALLTTKIKGVLVRSEQNAAHAASGYARAKGGIGVVAVTSGPGAMNVITGIATAFADSIPMIILTGQVEKRLIGQDVFQEADVTGAAESFVKFSYQVRHAADIPRIIKEAFYIAVSGRPGPVLIDLPIDVQTENVSKVKEPEEVNLRTYKPTVQGNAAQMKKVLKELAKAKAPILLVGGGVIRSDAKEEVRAFAEKYQIPAVSTMMGLGVFPTKHPLYYGMVGNNGYPWANRAMNKADLLIFVGARFADRAISQPDLITEGKGLIHIDVDPAEIGKTAAPTVPLVGNAKSIFQDLLKLEEEPSVSFPDWLETMEVYRSGMQKSIKTARKQKASLQNADGKGNPAGVSPADFLRVFSEMLAPDSIYVADVGLNQIWSCLNYEVREGMFMTSGGMGTMGYALPAAFGAKFALPERQVVSVMGDGGFQMAMPELATIRQNNIPLKAVVLSNGTLGMVYEYQKLSLGKRYTMVDIMGAPDLSKIAAAYGIGFWRVKAGDDYREMISGFLKEPSASLMEVLISPEEGVRS